MAGRGHAALKGGPPQPPVQARLLALHARSAATLGQRQDCILNQAQRQAERIIELRDYRTRSRAFGQLLLVTVLIAQGKHEEACVIAHQVLTTTQSLGSYQVVSQLLHLRQLLEPYRATPSVADFLACLEQTLRERVWLYHWLTKHHGEPATEAAEES